MNGNVDVIGSTCLLLLGCYALTALVLPRCRAVLPRWFLLARCTPLASLGAACLFGWGGLCILLRQFGRPLDSMWVAVPLTVGAALLAADSLADKKREFWRGRRGRGRRRKKPAPAAGKGAASNDAV